MAWPSGSTISSGPGTPSSDVRGPRPTRSSRRSILPTSRRRSGRRSPTPRGGRAVRTSRSRRDRGPTPATPMPATNGVPGGWPRACASSTSSARNRRSERAGSRVRNDTPAHAVTREQAILMWTRDAGRVLRWDGIGTLTPGSNADMIVVDRDPMACPIEQLARTRVLRTVVSGRVVHDAAAL